MTIIDLKDYELSGGGKLGESFIKKDNPDILLKLYSTQLEKMMGRPVPPIRPAIHAMIGLE